MQIWGSYKRHLATLRYERTKIIRFEHLRTQGKSAFPLTRSIIKYVHVLTQFSHHFRVILNL